MGTKKLSLPPIVKGEKHQYVPETTYLITDGGNTGQILESLIFSNSEILFYLQNCRDGCSESLQAHWDFILAADQKIKAVSTCPSCSFHNNHHHRPINHFAVSPAGSVNCVFCCCEDINCFTSFSNFCKSTSCQIYPVKILTLTNKFSSPTRREIENFLRKAFGLPDFADAQTVFDFLKKTYLSEE